MLKITIWTSLSYSLSILLYGLLIYQNEEKKVALALFISGLLTLVLDFVLAPRYGVLIIPLIRLLASYLQFGVLLYFHYRISKYGLLTKKNFFSLLFCFLVMLSVTILLNPINSVLAFIIGLLVYVICLIISGVLRNQDKTLVIKLGKEILGISNKIK
jgi:O-antigen/teichoic acid export membrane protein